MATSYRKRTKPSVTWVKRTRRGLIWREALKTWKDTPEAWQMLKDTTWTKRTKP
jgi:hypothetical protein